MDKEDQKQTEAKTDDKAIQEYLCWDLAQTLSLPRKVCPPVAAKKMNATQPLEELHPDAEALRGSRTKAACSQWGTAITALSHNLDSAILCLSMLVLFLTASKSIYYCLNTKNILKRFATSYKFAVLANELFQCSYFNIQRFLDTSAHLDRLVDFADLHQIQGHVTVAPGVEIGPNGPSDLALSMRQMCFETRSRYWFDWGVRNVKNAPEYIHQIAT